MTDTEELLRRTFSAYEAAAPNLENIQLAANQRNLNRRMLIIPVAASVVVAAVVAAAFMLLPNSVSQQTPAIPGSEVDLSQLTGKAVGEALGLEPDSSPGFVDCDGGFAEYVNGTGYCSEGVSGDEFELALISHQIVGFPRTPALQQEVVLSAHGGSLTHASVEEILLYRVVSGSVWRQVYEEKQVRAADPDSPVDTTAPPLPETNVQVGRTYAYNLPSHCGVEWIVIDGEAWRAAEPQGNGNPPNNWGDPKVGLLRLATDDEALYTDELNNLVIFTRQPDEPVMQCA